MATMEIFVGLSLHLRNEINWQSPKMKSVKSNIEQLQNNIPHSVKVVAVSKTKPVDLIMEAYEAGQRIFGENRVQELISKHPAMPEDIEWHMIGHLQSKKVKLLAPFISIIHSVDTLKLLGVIQAEALKAKRKIGILLQVHIAEEENKYGFSHEEIRDFFMEEKNLEYPDVNFKGLMGMASYTEDREQIRSEFNSLSQLFKEIRIQNFDKTDQFTELSMGMSGDYQLAVDEGSTMIRVGTLIFGGR